MTGIFILSLDTEIAWGTYAKSALELQRWSFDNNRLLVRRLVEILDKYKIPATWAVVGHLFLNHCEGHPDVLQPHYAWAEAPDAQRDPCSDIQHNDWYYGPDIIKMIRDAKVSHEIGTHTFTHVMAGDPAVTREIWESQLTKTVAIHGKHGLKVKSIVYPQNKIAYLESLSKFGIITYRGEEHHAYAKLPRQLRRAIHFTNYALGSEPPTYAPASLREGDHLVNLPSSQFLMTFDGIRKFIPLASRLRQAKLGLDRAENENRLYHLWFHPFNLGSSEKMFTALDMILSDVAWRRDRGGIRVMTMQQAAQWILNGMPADE
jgi:hypothetical protein